MRAEGVTEALLLDAASFYDLAATHPDIWKDVREVADRRQRQTEEILLSPGGGERTTCLI